MKPKDSIARNATGTSKKRTPKANIAQNHV